MFLEPGQPFRDLPRMCPIVRVQFTLPGNARVGSGVCAFHARLDCVHLPLSLIRRQHGVFKQPERFLGGRGRLLILFRALTHCPAQLAARLSIGVGKIACGHDVLNVA